jgi:parallel beta-helix repeat protein
MLWLALMVSVLWVVPAWGATYYVSTSGSDGNACTDGNISAPKRNIAGSSGGISCLFPGDTLFIRGGTYNEQIRPPGGAWMRSGTGEGSRVTIAAYQQEVVVLQPFSGNAVLSLEQTGNFSWMTFERLVFDGINTSGVAHIAGDTHHLRFRNCEFKNSHVDGNSHGFGGSGGHHHEFLGIYIHNVTGYGAYFSGADSLWDHVTIVDNGGYGLHFYDKASHIDNTVVRNSVIARNGFNNQFGGGGIVFFHGDNQRAYNNLIYGNFEGIGIRSSCNSCRIYNNTIYNNQFRAIQILGETFDYEYPPGSGIFREIRPPTNVYMQNNIMAVNGNVLDHQNGTIAAFDHNVCQGTNQSQCDRTGNPAFEDAGSDNFKIGPTSDARNTGIDLSSAGGFTIDYAGDQRGQGGAWDIGAYEYNEGVQPCPPNCPQTCPPDCPPSGNPIYVRGGAGSDSNTCTSAENPATAKQHLLGASGALSCMVTPGKVLYVEGNGQIYSEEIDTTSIIGGDGPSFTTATRLEGYGSPLPVLRAPAGGNINLWVRGSNSKYLIFKKLIIDGNNDTYNTVAVAAPAHHIRFEEVEVKNTLGRGFEGIHISSVDNVEVVDTFIHDVQRDAIKLEGTINGFLCQRCHLFSAQGDGLLSTSSGTKTNVTIQETEVRNNSGDGLDLENATGTVVQNMLNHSNGGIGFRIRPGSSGTRAYNNTLYGNTGVGLQCDAGASSTEMRNNIVYGNTAGNILNNCAATVARNLCAVSSADCAVAGNPLFVSAPSDLHLSDGSPGINAGETISTITTDYSGNPRQQDGQDIGAYERTQTGPTGPGTTEQPCNLVWAGWFF